MLNQLVLQGRLTKDVERVDLSSGKTLYNFSLATDGRRKDESIFINCVAFEKVGENLEKYCSKGDMICVIGAINQRKYQRQDGSTNQVVEVLVDSVEFLMPKKEEPSAPNPDEILPGEEVEEKPPLADGWHYDKDGKAVKDTPAPKKTAPKKK